MFFRMVRGAFLRQWKKMLMIAFTVALGASLATAMLNVMMDVGDKVNQELKAYGANITVVPKATSVITDLYEVEGAPAEASYLREDALGNIKTIFWAFNIVDFTPFLDTEVRLANGNSVTLSGSWFAHHMELPTGETLDTGLAPLRSWWEIKEGSWLSETEAADKEACMVGVTLAEREGIAVGDTLTLTGSKGSLDLRVKAVFDGGGTEDEEIFTLLPVAQALSGTEGKVTSVEVSALTTPDNDLAIKAQRKGPQSLSVADYETWYCTAYVSSICYQIQEVIPDSVASPVRQVADSEGAIMEKTELLMVLITLLALLGAALGITNLITASVMERSDEIGLLKAVGATNGRISALILGEIILTGIAGGAVGYLFGFGFAQIIGHTVFSSAIEMKPMVIPIVAVLVILLTLLGSVPAIRFLTSLHPTEVLHGR
ncbi:MAG: ABC transporter permease [Lachnospiraceae bacterium]|nr:ABC transporter permease [Lachnospiraceae bacterium]